MAAERASQAVPRRGDCVRACVWGAVCCVELIRGRLCRLVCGVACAAQCGGAAPLSGLCGYRELIELCQCVGCSRESRPMYDARERMAATLAEGARGLSVTRAWPWR